MRLTLTVLSFCNSTPADARTRSFDKFPVTIGRSSRCDYILEDASRYISSNHAVITCADNRLSVQDNSANGVFLNGAATPVGRNLIAPLENGDKVDVGDYILEVTIEPDTAQIDNQPADSTFGVIDAGPTPAITDSHDPFRTSQSDVFQPSAPADDPFAGDWETTDTPEPMDSFLAKESDSQWPDWSTESATDQPGHADSDLDLSEFAPPVQLNVDGLQQESETSGASPAPNEDLSWLPGTSTSTIPVQDIPTAPGQDIPIATETEHALESTIPPSLHALLSAAALRPEDFSNHDEQETLEQTGRLLAQMIDAMMLLLQSRAAIKNEIRSDITVVARTNNNPLKFSYSATEALTKLLSENTEGYMASEAAISEAVEDLKQHQLAMLDGMKGAVASLISQFDPVTLARKLEKSGGIIANIPITREAKLWEMFCEKYDDIRNEAVNDFGDVFGSEFRKAYEKRIKELGREPDF